jgi:hypothetical protein
MYTTYVTHPGCTGELRGVLEARGWTPFGWTCSTATGTTPSAVGIPRTASTTRGGSHSSHPTGDSPPVPSAPAPPASGCAPPERSCGGSWIRSSPAGGPPKPTSPRSTNCLRHPQCAGSSGRAPGTGGTRCAGASPSTGSLPASPPLSPTPSCTVSYPGSRSAKTTTAGGCFTMKVATAAAAGVTSRSAETSSGSVARESAPAGGAARPGVRKAHVARERLDPASGGVPTLPTLFFLGPIPSKRSGGGWPPPEGRRMSGWQPSPKARHPNRNTQRVKKGFGPRRRPSIRVAGVQRLCHPE